MTDLGKNEEIFFISIHPYTLLPWGVNRSGAMNNATI